MNRITIAHPALLLAATLCLPQLALAQTTHIVTVGDNFFSPSNLTIQVGDSVEFRNAVGGNSHNVIWQSGGFSNQPTASSFTYTVTFNSAGTFDYECSIHGGMDGSITVQGGGGGADLEVTNVNASSGTYEPGGALPLSISIDNIGDEASGAYSVTYYASTDSNITGADTELGSNDRPSLAGGVFVVFDADAAFPVNMPVGDYFIGAIIDINDANNANNVGVDNTPVTVMVHEEDQADLALAEVSAPSGSFAQGAAISVDAEVQNIGNTASGAFAIDFYASANNTITVQDRLLGTENRAALAAGADSSGPFNVTIPANLAPGNYFIGGIIDIDDANNGNNVNLDNEALTVTAASTFQINAGLNDSWYNPATDGQGFFITVFPDIERMFIAWFTYELERPPQNVTAQLGEPGHRWITAFGSYTGDTATLDIEIAEGGVFDDSPPVPTRSPDGTITVTFSSCTAGTVDYNIPSVNRSGTVPIQRLADDNVPFCEELNP